MRFLLTFFIGLIVGAALIYFIFVGAPRTTMPLAAMAPVKAPDQAGDPPGTVVLTLDEQFFQPLLDTIFRDLGTPSFQLAQLDARGGAAFAKADAAHIFRRVALQTGGCDNRLTIAPEGSNVKTSVRLVDGKVIAPLAFSGNYNVLGTCRNFKGWAQADIQLSFDQSKQTLYGIINVEGVNLEGAAPIIGGFITPLVQRAINERVNPLQFLRAQQLALNIPVQATGGTLNSQVKDVRADVVNNSLRLHITYDFKGSRAAGGGTGVAAQPSPSS
jgi:hypothetical protein